MSVKTSVTVPRGSLLVPSNYGGDGGRALKRRGKPGIVRLHLDAGTSDCEG